MSKHCRFCGASLTLSVVDLGATPLANSNLPDRKAIAGEKSYPLHVMLCENCLLSQTTENIPAEDIFHGDYAYFSSFSSGWVEHARQYAEEMSKRFELDPGSLVMEIASNDGYLLKHFVTQGIPVLGVEPAGNCAEVAAKKGVPTVTEFFNRKTAHELKAKGHQADLTVANNVLAHVPDISDFIAGFKIILKPDGVSTFEFPHLFNLINSVQFDTIYHEHYFYLSLFAVERILAKHDLRVFDVQTLPTHGGSLRVFACHKAASFQECPNLLEARQLEKNARLNQVQGYEGFLLRVERVRDDFLKFLKKAKADGKKIAGYGAAAKGNTFMNYCGVTASDISFVADKNPHKQGRLLPGVHAPIVSPDEIWKSKPDYIVIFPWNLAPEVASELDEIRQWGGQFVTAIPELRVF